MPNTKSAIRRTKRTQAQALVNRVRKSKYKSTIKQMSIYLNAGKIKEAKSFLPKISKSIPLRVWPRQQKNKRTKEKQLKFKKKEN